MDGITKADVWCAMHESWGIVMDAVRKTLPADSDMINAALECYEDCLIKILGLNRRKEDSE